MRRTVLGTSVMLAALWVAASGNAIDPRLREADLAWDRGDYPTALREYLALLNTADAERLLEPIALQTGELFETIELTSDGGAPRFSPDGRSFTYEIGRGVSRRTRLTRIDAPTQPIAEIDGYGASFAPDGSRIAYLKLQPTPAMLELETAAEPLTGQARTEKLAALARLTEPAMRIVVRDMTDGTERELPVGDRRKNAVLMGADGVVLFTGADEANLDQIFAIGGSGTAPAAITKGAPGKQLQEMNAAGTAALFTHRAAGRGGAGGRGGGGAAANAGPGSETASAAAGAGSTTTAEGTADPATTATAAPAAGRGAAPQQFGIVALPSATATIISGTAPTFSADGRQLAYVTRTDDRSQVMLAAVASPTSAKAVRSGAERVDEPSLSRDGSRIAFQVMANNDWEVHVVNADGSGEARVTREIQHDLLPRFLTPTRLLGLVGEARHRRSYLYDLETNTRQRLFHNNTVRTIAPEYDWVPSPDGTKLLVVSERDGDTVSPQRGVYLMDLSKKVGVDAVRARLRASLAAEEALRAKGRKSFAPIADGVKRVVGEASTARIFDYEKSLFDFDSKHITRPGNKLASAYLFDKYTSFGYTPEYQWFAGRGALGGQTANVIAKLPGTVNPELVYVVSSHYDSVAIGPGADDDSSGTAALLETARILAKHPQPATIVFASFTGEEAGLLGSREYVRRAVADKIQIAGALNNDMIGWANDHRLDNTIRYSNAGIRDIQHGAAMQFSDLITYDALYYKSTDAHAYYEAYGDIVGGIGSYPVLGNPHYHQAHDNLETINHQLITEVAKTTAATLMLLASSPSRLKGLTIDSYENGSASISWTPSPEKGVANYLVAWGPPGSPESNHTRVNKPSATVKAPEGSVIAVKAVNQKGLEGWDWARITVRAPVKTESR